MASKRNLFTVKHAGLEVLVMNNGAVAKYRAGLASLDDVVASPEIFTDASARKLAPRAAIMEAFGHSDVSKAIDAILTLCACPMSTSERREQAERVRRQVSSRFAPKNLLSQ